MSTADRPSVPTRIALGLAAASVALGVSATVASATTEPTEPPVTLAVDGSAQPTSPEAAAFCQAEVDLEAISASGAEGVSAAADALVDLAPAEVAPAAEALIANAVDGADDEAYEAAYAEMLGYMRINCGYAEVDVTASEYVFDGLPADIPPGPAIVAFENVGEEVHEIVIVRILDGSTSVDDLFALPVEEWASEAAFAGVASALPGGSAQFVIDLVPGNYVAFCTIPEGATPEVMEQFGPLGSLPAGVEVGPPHHTLGMIHEFHV